MSPKLHDDFLVFKILKYTQRTLTTLRFWVFFFSWKFEGSKQGPSGRINKGPKGTFQGSRYEKISFHNGVGIITYFPP
jgi:hypothetical protein